MELIKYCSVLFLYLILSCNTNNSSTTRNIEWLPEPDLIERLKYQKTLIDSIIDDSIKTSQAFIKIPNKN